MSLTIRSDNTSYVYPNGQLTDIPMRLHGREEILRISKALDTKGYPGPSADIAPRDFGAKTILTMRGGQFTWVDDDTYEWARLKNWFVREGYVVTTNRPAPEYRSLRLHRLIMGAKPGQVVDHIDGNPLNNLRSNLRLCTQRQNTRNRRKSAGTRSQFKGVWLAPVSSAKPWRAQIRIAGKVTYLGSFADEASAAAAYDEAAIKEFGEFARINFDHSRTCLCPDCLAGILGK